VLETYIVLFLVAFTLNVVDALLTDEIISRGGVEKNPVMKWIMLQPVLSPYRWSIKLGVVVLFGWLAFPQVWAILLFMAPFAWVVYHNLSVLDRMKEKEKDGGLG